jgi:hypothetical protein
MAKNLTNFNDFQNKRKGINESKIVEETKVNEGFLKDDVMVVMMKIDIPVSLLKAFATKVKSETGQDIHSQWSDSLLSDEIAKYVFSNFMNIENLPVSIITGEKTGAQAQGVGQAQAQIQPQAQIQAPQGQSQTVEVAPAPQGQQVPAAAPQNPQQTAQQIPSAE